MLAAVRRGSAGIMFEAIIIQVFWQASRQERTAHSDHRLLTRGLSLSHVHRLSASAPVNQSIPMNMRCLRRADGDRAAGRASIPLHPIPCLTGGTFFYSVSLTAMQPKETADWLCTMLAPIHSILPPARARLVPCIDCVSFHLRRSLSIASHPSAAPTPILPGTHHTTSTPPTRRHVVFPSSVPQSAPRVLLSLSMV